MKRRVFTLAPVMVQGQSFQISHVFTDEDITKLMMMPKMGKPITFSGAYELRWSELSFCGKLFQYTVQSTPLDQFCRDRGYYIEFSEEELYVSESTKLQH